MYKGKENLITAIHFQKGEECIVTGFGQFMIPILKSGQPVRVIPANNVELKKNDIIFCKVGGHFHLHKITAIKNNNQFQISNNHGNINGWVTKGSIYGKVVEIL